MTALPTFDDVREIECSLGEFPLNEIMTNLDAAGIAIASSRIPQQFAKYFSVMRAVSGGALAGKSLVDFGCGLGVFVAEASRLGMKAEGIDAFTEYDGRCRDGMTLIAHCISEENQPVSTILDFLKEEVHRQADFVTSFGVLEHIHGTGNRELAIWKMMQALKPGGHLILTCGPNRRFPIDFFHYGPRFVFYHCLPIHVRRFYLRLLAKKGQNHDPAWLNGMSVNELRAAISNSGGINIDALFPLWIRLANHRLLRSAIIRRAAVAAAEVLSSIKAEPVIILIAQKAASI